MSTGDRRIDLTTLGKLLDVKQRAEELMERVPWDGPVVLPPMPLPPPPFQVGDRHMGDHDHTEILAASEHWSIMQEDARQKEQAKTLYTNGLSGMLHKPYRAMGPIEREQAEQRAMKREVVEPSKLLGYRHTAALHQVLGQIYTEVKVVLQEFTLTMETHVEADGRVRLLIEAKYDPFDEVRKDIGKDLGKMMGLVSREEVLRSGESEDPHEQA